MKAIITTSILATTLLPLMLSPAHAATLTCKDLFASQVTELSSLQNPAKLPYFLQDRVEQQIKNFSWPKDQAPALDQTVIDSMYNAFMISSVSARDKIDVPVGSVQWRGPKRLRYFSANTDIDIPMGALSAAGLQWRVERGSSPFRVTLEVFGDLGADLGVQKALSGKVFQQLRSATEEIIKISDTNSLEGPEKIAQLFATIARLEKEMVQDVSSLRVQENGTLSQAKHDGFSSSISEATADYLKSYYRMDPSQSAVAASLRNFLPLLEVQGLRVWRESSSYGLIRRAIRDLQRSTQALKERSKSSPDESTEADRRWVRERATELLEEIQDTPRYPPAPSFR